MRQLAPLNFLRRLLLPRDKNNAEFWVSHLLIIASTVLGVYLAASEGYHVAVTFERVKSDRQSYYLQSALLSELRDNIDHMERWRTRYQTVSKNIFRGRGREIRLETHVWDGMAGSKSAYEVPVSVLNGIRRFYRRSESNLAIITETDLKKFRVPDLDQMTSDEATMRTRVIPVLERNIAELRRRLADANVTLADVHGGTTSRPESTGSSADRGGLLPARAQK